MVNPEAKALLSGNQAMSAAMGGVYASPMPVPESAPYPRHSRGRLEQIAKVWQWRTGAQHRKQTGYTHRMDGCVVSTVLSLNMYLCRCETFRSEQYMCTEELRL